ncbi:hypothetical protein [Vibrio parahaemolyticus]|uniref:hypothetical protein n=1 Tax=Vibrio parahaemolyticus TaxID=670 RepID=UPI00287866E0|nr:hypothetical protein [Vibrio parahaemolyticus]MDS1925675.1 hypothetical protein [Vibrio parahaemolyticus]
MAKFQSIYGFEGLSVGLVITGNESLLELNEAALDYADKTMTNSANHVASQWPVIEKNEIRNEQIGWVEILVKDTEYKINHLNLEREPLDSNWNAREFYLGVYE